MPVILGEMSVLTKPLSGVRMCELATSCLAFSLAAGTSAAHQLAFFHFCMFTWCFFFSLTLLILLVDFVQIQSLIPVSWKNLPVTVATLGALMHLAASVGFPFLVVDQHQEARRVAAVVASCLACLAYTAELVLIRRQGREQRGYMASAPGMLKVFQVFGGCVMFLLLSTQQPRELPNWHFWLSVAVKIFCFLLSLAAVLVMVGDCATRCPFPFPRLLAAACVLAVLLYGFVTAHCVAQILEIQTDSQMERSHFDCFMETVVACLILLSYMVDLAFSVKLLCDRA